MPEKSKLKVGWRPASLRKRCVGAPAWGGPHCFPERPLPLQSDQPHMREGGEGRTNERMDIKSSTWGLACSKHKLSVTAILLKVGIV